MYWFVSKKAKRSIMLGADPEEVVAVEAAKYPYRLLLGSNKKQKKSQTSPTDDSKKQSQAGEGSDSMGQVMVTVIFVFLSLIVVFFTKDQIVKLHEAAPAFANTIYTDTLLILDGISISAAIGSFLLVHFVLSALLLILSWLIVLYEALFVRKKPPADDKPAQQPETKDEKPAKQPETKKEPLGIVVLLSKLWRLFIRVLYHSAIIVMVVTVYSFAKKPEYLIFLVICTVSIANVMRALPSDERRFVRPLYEFVFHFVYISVASIAYRQLSL